MKKIIIILVASFSVTILSAQSLKVNAEQETDNDQINFIAKKDYAGTMSVVLHFMDLRNTEAPERIVKSIKSDKELVYSLKPINKKDGLGYKYEYTCYLGDVMASPDTNFVYRLPYSTSQKLKCLFVKYKQTNVPFSRKMATPLLFTANKGDTIFAMRKGKVVDIRESELDEINKDSTSSVTKETVTIEKNGKKIINNTTTRGSHGEILIEHEDGSFARYSIFHPQSEIVSIGDEVSAGTPLALAGSIDGKTYKMLITTFYQALYNDKQAGRILFYPIFNTNERNIKLKNGESY